MKPREHAGTTLPRFSLNRRVTVLVLFLTALVVGFVAANWIPVELIPQGFEGSTLRIRVPWGDAPPAEVMEKIAEPLEEELRTVKGIDRIVSLSLNGRCFVFMRFKQGTDMDVAYREVRDRVERSRRQFPSDVERVYIRKDDTSGIPVTVLGVAVDPGVLDSYDLIQRQVIMPLERVDGVASVQADGLTEKEILIELDRDRTTAAGLNIYELGQQLGDDSFTMASGNVLDGSRKLLLRSVARYESLEELENRPVGPRMRLKDIATVSYAEPDRNFRVRAMSKPAYAIIVYKEGEANAREVSGRVADVFEKMQDDPRLADVEMIPLFDTGEVIEDSLSTLLQSGFIGGLVAASVLFLFLRRFRLTLVVNLSVPLSLLVALTVMYFWGESLNIITLLALMVCVGLLVDNSIVVAENIDRMHKLGYPKRKAAIQGAGEIGLAITMSTLTTVVVFVPVSLVEGEGQFFLLRMAIPIAVALIASLFVALIFVPLTVYLTLPADGTVPKRGPGRRQYERLTNLMRKIYDLTFNRLAVLYQRLLGRALHRRLDLVLVMTALMGVTLGISFGAKKLEITEVDENQDAGFTVNVETSPVNTLEETEEWFLEAEKIVEEHAEEWDLAGWFCFHQKTRGVLQGWFNSPRTSNISREEVTAAVLDVLPKKPGMELTTGDEDQLSEGPSEEMYQVTLYGEDPDQLAELVEGIESILVQVPGVIGSRRGYEKPPSELGLRIDRTRSQKYGVNPQAIAGVVAYALRGQPLPKYRTEGKEIPVRIRYREEDRNSLSQLSDFYVPTDQGGFLPVSALTEVEMLSSPEAIIRRDKRVARTVSVELEKENASETRGKLSALTQAIDLPEGVTVGLGARRAGFDEDVKGMLFALSLSVLFIYLLMGLLFESFILPLSIILTIPLASLGVFWIHLITGRSLDFLGIVGAVLLVGVVVNNGIVLIDYVNRLRSQGLERREAILRAAELRFRPIMMTAITTIGGMVPLAVSGQSQTGLSYVSFSYTLIGGMTTATLLTLLVVPIFYTFFDDIREVFSKDLGRVKTWRGWRSRRFLAGPSVVSPAGHGSGTPGTPGTSGVSGVPGASGASSPSGAPGAPG